MSTLIRSYKLCSNARAASRLISSSCNNHNNNRGNAVNRIFGMQVKVCEPWSRAGWRLGFSRGAKYATGYSAVARKSLDSIMKLDSVKHASPEEIASIWNEYHIGRGHISAVMSSQLFKALQQRASDCPLFVIPLWRGEGFVSILLQDATFTFYES
ncbi:hypothetical protein O6H91_07G041000 [Diphasiastrum complanatum]|uniref:Uncharacterized protein n=1 Tax=Diphasiastrum complanatum TaxID=34168 RepID=A0ACC2D4A9_DIPCM|nr:hypothetical protein O6H91_07G041000 [Diphasiastrum complanatum]